MGYVLWHFIGIVTVISRNHYMEIVSLFTGCLRLPFFYHRVCFTIILPSNSVIIPSPTHITSNLSSIYNQKIWYNITETYVSRRLTDVYRIWFVYNIMISPPIAVNPVRLKGEKRRDGFFSTDFVCLTRFVVIKFFLFSIPTIEFIRNVFRQFRQC